MQYLDQLEGKYSPKNQAPAGSLTIASKPINEDDDFPKGFYLRNIQGELWLRGYIADDLHVWNPDDFFVFCLENSEDSLDAINKIVSKKR